MTPAGAAGGDLPAPGAARPRALRGTRPARDAASTGPGARRRLRRRPVPGHDAGARPCRWWGWTSRPQAAAVAWKQQGVPAVCGLLDRAPLAAGSCAAVTMFHVLEHLHDPRAYLEAARALLRPRRPPDRAGAQRRLAGSSVCWARPGPGVDVPRHLIDFRARDLEALLDALRLRSAAAQVLLAARQSGGPGQQPRAGARPHGAPHPPRAGERRRGKLFKDLPTSRWWRPRCRSRCSKRPCRAGFDRHGGGAQEVMRYAPLPRVCPAPLRRYVLHFEARHRRCRGGFRRRPSGRARACSTPARAKASTRRHFRGSATAASTSPSAMRPGTTAASTPWRTWPRCRSATARFDAAINIVTLEHVRGARRACWPRSRATLAPGGRCWWWRRTNGKSTRRRTTTSATRATACAYLLEEAGLRARRNPSRGRLLPPARPAAAERVTILFRRLPLALVPSGGGAPGTAGADSALSGFPRPGPQLHPRVHMHGKQSVPDPGWRPARPRSPGGRAARIQRRARRSSITRRAVAFGPRPPGSPAIEKLQAYLARRTQDTRLPALPKTRSPRRRRIGPVAMKNIICRFPGTSGRAVVDHRPLRHEAHARASHFVGANDGGSSTGFLLEMAAALARPPAQRRRLPGLVRRRGGHSANGPPPTASTAAGTWPRAGRPTARSRRIKALINVDMIGDRDLGIMQETNSSPPLFADRLGHRAPARLRQVFPRQRPAAPKTTTCRSRTGRERAGPDRFRQDLLAHRPRTPWTS